ncbi:exo-alpha-sialidase [Kribbella shirazensis]|uniref:exo-alpha-sialidase n=1 Tax=Kribbella shirazensis TaxID=1105143 RepID=A0A7X6A1U1_9ACTN|nr:exo-alpha-sialidase [Kribbella shirazensis]NIK58581.1 sialidase-1 [Kribbella shirazensis]
MTTPRPINRCLAALAAGTLSLGVVTAAQPPASAADPALASQDLAAAGVGSPYYRIPALAVSTKGTVLASYDARPTLGDLPSNIRIVLRRSTDNGKTWQEQQIVRQDPAPQGYGDPSLIVDRVTGRIFLFYAAGQNQGYGGGATGNDPDDPDVLQADYSYSDDDGLTWKHRRITPQIKDPAWGGMFAASGAGIQIKRGPYAGRLVQQYSVRYQGQNWAASAYSDDHGDTWQMGELAGPGTDENKSVELEDGRLMLNSRARPNRLVAYSSDGGESWQGLHADPNLIDPADNGSILRYNENAVPGTEQASWLLFSNNESTSSRTNLVVKQSCDNGRTWPIRKVVEPGFAAYSTLTRLPDGAFGLLWESQDYRRITFSKFDRDWLDGVCAPLTVTAPRDAVAGGTTTVSVKVTSQSAGDLDGTVTLTDLPAGWSAGTVQVPRLSAGQSTEVSVPLTVPSGTSTNAYPIRAVYRTDHGQSTTPIPTQIVVRGGATVWEDTTPRSYDGTELRDVSDQVGAVKDLAAGAVTIKFRTTATSGAAALLSSADPISQVRDLVVSLNSGKPYVEFRTGSSTYPVRIQSSVNAADGNDHELIFASSNGISSLILDGEVIGQTATQRFFRDVDAMTPVHTLNPTGLPNLTLGGNRAYVTPPAALTNRWLYTGTIHSIRITGS